VRVIIADDSVLLREGVARLLVDSGAEVIGKVGDAAQLLTLMSSTEPLPDVCVIDVRMPPTFLDEGLRAAQYVEERYAAELIRQSTDGVGYLLKDRVADVDEFSDAVKTVADGGTVIDPEVVQQILARAPRSDPLDSLTPRERDVLTAMAEGKSNAGIASALVVGQAAVEKHIGNIFAKLGLLGDSADHRRVMAVLRYLGAIR
jgi:DNA-binding NarL/FixJ family response regulator